MTLKFQFGLHFEKQRVKHTLKKLAWFEEQGNYVRLPKGNSEKEMLKQIEKEYQEEVYIAISEKIKRVYLSKSSNVLTLLIAFDSFKLV